MRISHEPERLDARVPLGLLAVALVILGSSALLTLGVRSVPEREPAAGGLSLTAPAAASVESVGTEPIQAADLFSARGAPGPTRARPAELNRYGWVDRERGLVRIPIARAKQLLLESAAGPTQRASHTQRRGQP